MSAQRLHSVPTQATRGGDDGSTNGMTGSTIGNSYSIGFFGTSSAGNFITQVRNAVDSRTHRPPSATVSTQQGAVHLAFNEIGQARSSQQISDYYLPARKRADALMTLYWDIVHPLYPYLDKVETVADYDKLWTGESVTYDESHFLCVINTIFALSSQLDPTISPPGRRDASDRFLQEVRRLLDLWSTGSVRSIQTCLLLAQYFQSTNDPHQCWMFVSFAVRIAQSLGLHLPETSKQLSSPRQQQLLRRIWHGCVLMDRVVAMTYGRPTMIDRSVATAVPLPVSLDDEKVLNGVSQASGDNQGASVLDFFIHSLKLYDILQTILIEVYSPQPRKENIGRNDSEPHLGLSTLSNTALSILAVDGKLMEWERQLPAHLKQYAQEEQVARSAITAPQGIFLRQALVLRQRFLHIRLLALRPILSAFVASSVAGSDTISSFGSNLSHRIAHQCSLVCVRVAQETIDFVALHRPPGSSTTTGPLAAWWYNVLFVYSAATVLIAARLRSSLLADLTEDSILRSWQCAMSVLEGYRPFSTSIPKLLATLRLLYEEVPSRYSQYRQNTRPVSTSGFQDGDVVNNGADGIMVPLDNPTERRSRVTSPRLPAMRGPRNSYHHHQGFSEVPVQQQVPSESLVAAELIVPHDKSDHIDAAAYGADPVGYPEDFHGLNLFFDPDDMSWLNALPFDAV